jgi:hypothetical protein
MEPEGIRSTHHPSCAGPALVMLLSGYLAVIRDRRRYYLAEGTLEGTIKAVPSTPSQSAVINQRQYFVVFVLSRRLVSWVAVQQNHTLIAHRPLHNLNLHTLPRHL